jgi:hypothetical protein
LISINNNCRSALNGLGEGIGKVDEQGEKDEGEMICLSLVLHLDVSEDRVPPSVVLVEHYEGQKDQQKG